MTFQFSNTIPNDRSSRQPPSFESVYSYTNRRPILDTRRRDVGDMPTLYNIETNKPLPALRTKESWSASSTEVSSRLDSDGTGQTRNLPLWWTAMFAVLPVLAFTVTIVTLVAVYRVRPDATSPFDDEDESRKDSTNLLVRMSGTRLVFVAGFGGTIVPMLLSSLMALWHYPTSEMLFNLSIDGPTNVLPTPLQLSMLVGLSAGSVDELRKYIFYRCRRFKATETILLTRSAVVLLCAVFLAGLVLLADIGIHNFTTSVSMSLSTVVTEPTGAYGRGLSDRCIDFDRGANQGLPCTVLANATLGANAVAFDSGQIISMQRNKSKANSAWLIQDNVDASQDLVVLMPQTTLLDFDRDFVASTIAVATKCSPSTRRCDFRMNDGTGPNDTYVIFNCTETFRGALGAPETAAADTVSWMFTDDTTPPLNFKLDRNFQYAYFADPELDIPYNSIGANSDENPVEFSGSGAIKDDQLLQTYHLATAGIVPVQNNADGQTMLQDHATFPIGDSMMAYSLNCSVTAFKVNYTWYNGDMKTFTREAMTNGTILELAHGMQAMGMPSLSQAQSFASLTSSMIDFARAYANLHSQDTIALISSVMSPRANIQEATRVESILVRVPLWSFIALVICNTAFVCFAATLAARALLLNTPETRDMVAKLSVEGLAAAAFEDRNGKQDPGHIVEDTNDMFEESRIGRASRRVALRKATGGTVALRIEQPHL